MSQILKSLNVLGLNSGTSMDGIDAAVFSIGPDRGAPAEPVAVASGSDLYLPALKMELLHSELVEFAPTFKHQLARLVAEGQTDLRQMCLLNASLGEIFAQASLQVIRSARRKGIEIDLIGSHGQTIWHAPDLSQFWGMSTAGTLQLGDPSVIAARTGVTTIGDFRTADVALGGQGAPLTSFADQVIFGKSRTALGVLNLGGIANITVIDDRGQAVMAFDTGPANVLIDEAMRILYQQEFDENGAVAASGTANARILKELLALPYLHLPPPKTTGRELFGRSMATTLVEQWQANDISPADIVATLTAYTAASIVTAYEQFIAPEVVLGELVLAGGGEANSTLVGMLTSMWPTALTIRRHEDFGVSPKFKEALLFALLAYTTSFGIPNNVPACTGATKRICLGKLARA
ncbi:anhydro-N-acetylmuramic acid kinase [bacterium]|nr:anhydro-N-acetylmuramic acid kinase [bacterium]MBP9811467.1 anhydro-N-acetylmuramic acid kinase [bacterium]